MINVLIHK